MSTPSGIPDTFTFSYSYYLNDALKTITYPSTRVVTYTLDSAGRALKAVSGPTTYFDVTVVNDVNQRFTPDGRMIRAKLGNTLWETRDYRTPGTPTIFRLGTTEGAGNVHEVEYSFSGTQHNGNVVQQVIRHSGLSWTQNYTNYDGVNRLKTAVEIGGFNRTYGYDRWGNRWVETSTGFNQPDGQEPTSDIFDDNTNQISGTGNYDDAGNLTDYAPYTLAYDGENRMVSMSSGANGNMTLTYDGEGRRLKKVWNPGGALPVVTTVYVYDAFGQMAAEYQDGGTTEPGTRYLMSDWLGSTRVVTDGAGAVTTRHDFLPFGRAIYAGTNGRTEAMKYGAAPVGMTGRPWVRQLFTGHERDVEVDSALDYAGARYLSAGQGRFASPDPLFFQKEMLVDPQRWNLYAYVRNNPLRLVDPTGERIELTGETEEERKRQLAAIQEAVGKEAGARLAIQEDKKTGQFFVGITGDVSTFRDINPAASTFATIISLDEVAKFHVVASKERMDMGDGKEYTLSGLGAGGATSRDSNGQLHVFVQRPEEGYSSSWSGMSGWWPVSNNLGTATGHEFGHALEHMFYRLLGQSPGKEQSNRGALDLENKVRRLQRGPDAATRLKH